MLQERWRQYCARELSTEGAKAAKDTHTLQPAQLLSSAVGKRSRSYDTIKCNVMRKCRVFLEYNKNPLGHRYQSYRATDYEPQEGNALASASCQAILDSSSRLSWLAKNILRSIL